ncbi:ATP-binding sensor histidine kinase [Nostoc sp.]|uniref:ATP-binding sensor histidine kinase n=1 Tax=Nostoc sp. TaxID=1180 RepID=UPI002FF7A2A6
MSAKVDITVTLAGYQIREQLYSGSRTLVYRAVREADNQAVVIKLLKREYPTFSELVQFRNQYSLAKNLDIPGIIKPHSLEPYHNGYALVMEDFGGISLRQFTKEQPQNLEQFLIIALQLTDILHQLHQQRVIHKDIKPANILINPDTKLLKLIDFSISSLLPRETTEIQNPNVLEGTLAYLSPEQTGRMNRGIDYRSDFYSLGVSFFELLTGKLPFDSQDPMELVHCHIAKLPPNVCDVNTEIPLVLGNIVRKLMAKNAEDRYQSALGLKHDLHLCREQLKEIAKIEHFSIGERDISDRFAIPEKLYGREQEVKILLEGFERVANGASEFMLVAGFSGIGKTAVVNEVHKPIVRQRGYFIKGKYDQFNRNIPLSAFVQAFRDLMGQLLGESDTQLKQWKNRILTALGENAQVIIEVIPELEQIIGQQSPVVELSGSASQNRFNLLFQKFIQVFTTVTHPLVMFLDDLQWADSASLNLIQVSIGQRESGFMLLIGAYRDNEVSLAHPLILTLEEIKKTGTTVNTIALSPLSQESLNSLVTDTLQCSAAIAQPLTKLVYQKTQGNPFFSTQFLKALHEEGDIEFAPQVGHWQCDISYVRSLSLRDDVVEFMAMQLQKLPVATQNVLKLAACIGNSFDLATLAIIYEKSQAETATDLWKALQEGLVIPSNDIYKFYQSKSESQIEENGQLQAALTDEKVIVSYKFLHDRVQQAAYSLIPDNQKQLMHLKIGRLLLSVMNEAEKEEKIFEIVNQLNKGSDLIVLATEQERLAKLNLAAAQKAKSATAYVAAIEYATKGIQLLAGSCWQQCYDLTLALHDLAAEVACLSSDFRLMEQIVDEVVQNARQLLDKVKVYEVRILADVAQSNQPKAIKTALSILKLFGVSFPEQPTNADITESLQQTQDVLKEKHLEYLLELPEMKDLKALAEIRILATVTAAVYQAVPELLPLIVCKQVRLSVAYGNAAVSAQAYAWYGVILCGIGEIDLGDRISELAMGLLSRFESREFKASTINMVYPFIKPWKHHIQDSLAPLLDGYHSGLEMGTLEYAAYCAYNYCSLSFFLGKNLSILEPEMKVYSQALAQLKQEVAHNYLRVFYQSVLNFLGESKCDWEIKGVVYDEEIMLPKHQQANDLYAMGTLYINKLILCYFFNEWEEAIKVAVDAKQYLNGVSGCFMIPVFHFYDSLTHLAMLPNAQGKEGNSLPQEVIDNQKKLKEWSNLAPKNHLHKFYLVEAEQYRVLGQMYEAMDYYDRAIASAKANAYIQEEALSNELAGKFYLQWGKEKLAQVYIQEAYYCYAHWGAKAKVTDLEHRYPQLLAAIVQQRQPSLTPSDTIFFPAFHSTETSSSSSITESLDLLTVLKASQTLSGEIQLEKLLAALLRIVIENAGAEKCVLMLLRSDSLDDTTGDRLVIKGTVTANTQPIVLQRTPVEESEDIPLRLIYHVKHSLKPVVLADATTHPTFASDTYILNQQPKSILCSPILYRGKFAGILYLENNLTTGAFTSDRVEMLNLLCTQAAISLENARLYEQAQQTLAELRASEAQFQKVVDNIPGMVFKFCLATDGSFSTPYVSSGCYDLYEVDSQEVMAGVHNLHLMTHPDDRSTVERLVINSARMLTPFRQEWRIVAASGKIKWIQCASKPELQADGSVMWDGVVIDISDAYDELCLRKQAEAALQEKEQFLSSIYNGAEMSIFVVDVSENGRFYYAGWNALSERACGISSADAVGKTPAEVLDPAQAEIIQQQLAECARTEMPVYHEQCLTLDGQESWWMINFNPLKNNEGRIYRIIGTSFEISDRKRAEAAVQTSEKNLLTIFNNVNNAILVHDLNGVVLNANDSALKLYELDKDEIRRISVLEHCSAPDNPFHLAPDFWARALTGETVNFEWKSKKFRDGTVFDTDITLSRIILDGETVILGNIHDVSEQQAALRERKRAEAQLNQRTVELEETLQELQHAQTQMIQSEKMSGLGQLVAGVAHEINNPVNFIFGNLSHANEYTKNILRLLELYQKHYPNPDSEIEEEIEAMDLEFILEDLPKLIYSMRVGAERIQKIVVSLRTFSRMDEAEMKEVNIHEGIDSTLMILQHRLKAKSDSPGIEIVKDYGELPLVECYAGQLNQVFMNLLSNAIDALEEANTQNQLLNPTITICTVLVESKQVVIKITDNGTGIPAHIKQKLFDPFFTTKAVGKGTGMGLSISYQIVAEKHKGTLQCVSELGQGATFIIMIPICQS